MFFKNPGKPTKIKKIAYLAAAIILGLLLSFLLHAFIEIKYLAWAQNQSLAVKYYGGCFLPPWLQITLWVLGLVGGYFLGRWWWQKLYIERVWAKK